MNKIKALIPALSALFLSACTATEESATTVIGGADGPTAVFIAGKHNGVGALPVIVIAVIIIVVLFIYIKRRKK